MQTRQHLFLIGFMGCGKTYWGRILAHQTSLPFLDLDDLIVQRTGQSIAQIFTEHGESGFRKLEQKTLKTLEEFPASIIATGGGTPCFFDNMDWMNTVGTTVYLKTAPSLLAERLRLEKEYRPLLAGVSLDDLEAFIEKKVMEREPDYMRAKVILEQSEDEGNFGKRLELAVEML
jgi:shikimate kinase